MLNMFGNNSSITIKMSDPQNNRLNLGNVPSSALQQNRPRICCRLCLAPDNECVSIYQTTAADKEPLSAKILSCVRIKVHEQDRLSPRICHACISYLNSWQSFKNRCDAAQRKQRSWVGMPPVINSNSPSPQTVNQPHGSAPSSIQDKNALQQMLNKPNITIHTIQQNNNKPTNLPPPSTAFSSNHTKLQSQLKAQLQQRGVSIRENGSQENRRPIPSALMASIQQQMANGPLKRTHHQLSSGLDVSFIKSEPHEEDGDDEEDRDVMEIDPTQFLAQNHYGDDNEDNDDEPMSQQPESSLDESGPHLSSLGLHHINAANQFGNLSAAMQPGMHFLLQSSTSPNMVTSTPEAKPKMKLKFKPPPEVYDYTNPQKYRHLLTPNKLAFILRNLEFLAQVQDMTCKCCRKQYPSYKYFMSHMRKKYHHLPRNVCFKCLRQFTSKGQFIGHLKRKSCINLYAVVMADETISKEPPPGPVKDPNRPGTKDIIANKTYGCKLCSKTFRLKNDFRQHVYEEHAEIQRSKDIPGASCAYCNATFDDSQVRRRHYNNLDCIVFIICGTCEEKFDCHTLYIDHVYQKHLTQQLNGSQDEYGYDTFDQDGSGSNLRNPQNCPVCNKQYNNYYNVLRHMESKHPNQLPQIYQCQKCEEGFPRQNELREHLTQVHGEVVVRQQKQQQIQQHFQLIQEQNRINFTCKECNHPMTNLTDWIEHQHIEHAKFMCTKCEHVNEDRDEFALHCLRVHNNFSLNNLKVKFYSCPKCPNSYSTSMGLNDHLINDHGANPSEMADETMSENDEADPPSLMMRNGGSDDANANGICCRMCNQKMIDGAELKKHMADSHGIDTKFINCHLCQAKFMNEKGLKVHLFRAHGIRDDGGTAAVTVPPTPIIPPPALMLMKQVIANDIKEVECKICHIVYKNEEQLRIHAVTAHIGNNGGGGEIVTQSSTPSSARPSVEEDGEKPSPPPKPILWYQCRYCNESFNASKKLTIHMNSHDEIDHTDYTCKDCGTLYSTKKSLWVHRYKKHPRYPDASNCDVCNKTFFDKTELYYHSQTHSAAEMLQSQQRGSVPNGRLECTVCSLRFDDGDIFDRHTKMHELESSQALFSFLDASLQMAKAAATTTTTTKQESSTNSKENGKETEYQCDMCPKKFTILNALQVHRGWHYRSPDGRKVRDPNDMWHPDQLPPSKVKKMMTSSVVPRTASMVMTAMANNIMQQQQQIQQQTSPIQATTNQPNLPIDANNVVQEKPPPTCPYCQATFASGPNLRRHIIEIHRRNESKNIREQTGEPIFIEKARECSTCQTTFTTVAEWVDHKIMHARTVKPSQTYEWGCEICGKMVNRKERLIQHMLSHLNTDEFDVENPYINNPNTGQDDSNSQFETMGSVSTSSPQPPDQHPQQQVQTESQHDQLMDDIKNEEEVEIHDVHIDDNMDDSSEDEEDTPNGHHEDANSGYSCNLCNAYFETAVELKQHIAIHFVNGGMAPNNGQSGRSSSSSSSSSDSSSDSSSSDHSAKNNNGGLPCRLCGQTYPNPIEMVTCMNAHQITAGYQCAQCQLFFQTTKQFKDHQSIHGHQGMYN